MLIVKDDKVAAYSLPLSWADDKPVASTHGLFERAKESFDSAISPRMILARHVVLDAAFGDHGGETLGAEDRAAICYQLLWGAVLVHCALQCSNHVFGSWPSDWLERDEPAAVVVDDAEDPKWKEAEHPNEGQVDAPKLARVANEHSSRATPSFGFKACDHRAIPRAHLANRLSRDELAKEAVDSPAQLAVAETRPVDMETNNLVFELARDPVASCGLEPFRLRGDRAIL